MKLETLRSLRTMAGLPAMSIDEEAAARDEQFSFGEASAQDEPDGRQSWYIEMFCGEGGHYSVILYSDGEADIAEASGPPIPVNSSLGEKIIDAARTMLKIGKTFNLDEGAANDAGPIEKQSKSAGALSKSSHTTISNYTSFLKDLKEKLEKNGSTEVSVKLVRTNIVAYSFK